MKLIKNIFNENNKVRIFGLLTILILLWVVLYLIPDFLVLLFNTFLGNLILITITILTLFYNIKYGIFIGLVLIIMYRFSHVTKTNEGFTWSKESEQNFILTQSSMNPQNIFDTSMIQASQEEVDYFNENKVWPWSQKTKELYVNALNTNPYIRTLSENELNSLIVKLENLFSNLFCSFINSNMFLLVIIFYLLILKKSGTFA